jgi:simple sugar transport system substrate-binding protein
VLVLPERILVAVCQHTFTKILVHPREYCLKPAEVGATTTVTAPGATTTVTAPGATTTVTAPGATTTVTAPGATTTVTAPGEHKPGEGLNFVMVNFADPSEPFWTVVNRGWEEAAKILGVNASSNWGYGDLSTTLNQLDAAIGMGVDGIFIPDYEIEGIHPYIEKALNKGIAVVTMTGRDPAFPGKVVPFIGFDLRDQGYELGKYLVEHGLVKDGYNIAFFCEWLASYSQARSQGILDAFKDAGITVNHEIFEVGVDVAKVQDTMKSYLVSHPETNAIIGLGGLVTSAGGVVLQQLGYKPGQVTWAGTDLSSETLAAIKAGYGVSTVDEAYNYGFLGCIALFLKTKYDFIVGDLPVATVIVDQSNASLLEYWLSQGYR